MIPFRSMNKLRQSEGEYSHDEVERYVFPVYSNVQSSSNRNYRAISGWFYADDDEDIEHFLYELNSDDHLTGYMANYAKVGLRMVLLDKNELNFELPAGYSPTDEIAVTVRLKYIPDDDEDESKGGSTIVTFPCCGSDYGNLIYFTVGYMLVPCKDGMYRNCNFYDIVKAESFKV